MRRLYALLCTASVLILQISCTTKSAPTKIVQSGELVLTVNDTGRVEQASLNKSETLLILYHQASGALLFCGLDSRGNDRMPRLGSCWIYLKDKVKPVTPPGSESLPCGFGKDNSVIYRTPVPGSPKIRFETVSLEPQSTNRGLEIKPLDEFTDSRGEVNVIGPAGNWARGQTGVSLYSFGDFKEYCLGAYGPERESGITAGRSRTVDTVTWGGWRFPLDGSPAQPSLGEVSSPDGRVRVTGKVASMQGTSISLAPLINAGDDVLPSITLGINMDAVIVGDKETVVCRFDGRKAVLLRRVVAGRGDVQPFMTSTGFILAIRDTPRSVTLQYVQTR